jgi:hypothetical protein
MISRRSFLSSVAAAAGATGMMSGISRAAVDGKNRAIPKQIKMFCIDLNWLTTAGKTVFAPPGHWASTSPEEHVRWHEDLEVNVIHSFAVSCNGYAWYKNGFVPPQPGLKYDFFPEVVRLAHKKNMLVTSYYCIGANTRWGHDHPDLSYGTPTTVHIPFTDEYLDFLAKSIADGIKKTGMDVCTLDWLWVPDGCTWPNGSKDSLRAKGWLEAEKKLFTQLTGIRFPVSGAPSDEDTLAYERRAIDRCWERIRAIRDQTDRDCLLCLWVYDARQPSIAGAKLFTEVDWYINENPHPELTEFVQQRVRKQTRLIQNESGWTDSNRVTHDAKAFFSEPKHREVDLCGFAEPRDNGLPLPIDEYLSKPVEAFKTNGPRSLNNYNVAVLVRCYRGMPMDAVIPRKS